MSWVNESNYLSSIRSLSLLDFYRLLSSSHVHICVCGTLEREVKGPLLFGLGRSWESKKFQ